MRQVAIAISVTSIIATSLAADSFADEALIAVLWLPNVATSADGAKEAYEKGKACLDTRGYDAAITAFTEAIRLKPRPTKNDDVYFVRGVAYFWKGDYDKTIADFTESIRLDPKNTWAYSHRSLTYEKKGEKAKAKRDSERVKKLGGVKWP